MTKKEAIQRISWRFANHSSFRVNEKDIEAWNEIIDYINGQDKEILNNNYLFAKLFMLEYREQLKRYKTDIYDDFIPKKEIFRFLDKPMEYHYERLTEFLNETISERVIEETGDVKKFYEARQELKVEDVKLNMNQIITECLRKFSQK
ncbi:MAG: hypothetical protein AAF600_17285 [Bacteroidota bacterium]